MSTTFEDRERLNVSMLVERQLQAGRGEKLAYIAEDGTLTYEQLRRRVNRGAGLLKQLGVRREQRVLLVLDDTTVFPSLFLGALRLGAVPVPVSPLDNDENFRHFINDSYAEVVVTEAQLLPRLQSALAGCGVRFLARDGAAHGAVDLDQALGAQDDEFPIVDTHRDDAAFWLYSSGSTGKPKGVVHLHHDVLVTCRNFADGVLALQPDDVTFSTTKLFHAYGLGNGLSFPLWAGATATLMSGPTKPEPIIAALNAHRPTVYFSVPALYRAVAMAPEAEGALESVRLCVSAAEPLPVETQKLWQRRFGVGIVDGIGSTEMLHIYCSNRPQQIAPGTTGWPVPGYELRLVDDKGSELHGPATGHLQVNGDSCGAFYWHQHEKSKQRMRGEWYDTGDRYTRLADDSYQYVGRSDEMLKIGGLWVSPMDVEETLAKHPLVAAAAVIGVEEEGLTRLAAFVEVLQPVDQVALADQLRALCKEQLRRYAYPHIVTIVEALPRTLTGKVQRFALHALYAKSHSTGSSSLTAAHE